MEILGIKDYTELFWRQFILGDFKTVDNFLSPDCRLQGQFGQGIGSNDHVKVMAKLHEIQRKIIVAGADTTMKSVEIMRNKSQIRFMINSCGFGLVLMSLGFAIEWQQGIITTLIIIKGASETTFYVDDTEAPTVVCNLPATPSPNIETNNVPISPPSSDALEPVASIEPVRVVSANNMITIKSANEPTFRYGTLSVPESMLPYESLYPMTKSLCPPFIVPQPPTILPTIRITVIKCTNLVSRLKTVIPRPINCYVEVTVHNRTHSTPMVAHNSNPVFDSTNGNNQFVFDIPNTQSCNVQNGCIYIQVKDKHAVVAEDILAEVSIPFVSLRCCVDNASMHSTAESCYPLHLFDKHLIGSGSLTTRESTEFPDKDNFPCLYLSICKVDIHQWWLLEELRARDELYEQEIIRMKAEKAREMTLREKMKALKVAAKNHDVLICPDVDPAQRLHWVHEERVANCQLCDDHFGYVTRKYHCNRCGGVFCNACTSYSITAGKGQEIVRACEVCFNSLFAEFHASNDISHSPGPPQCSKSVAQPNDHVGVRSRTVSIESSSEDVNHIMDSDESNWMIN